MSIIRPALAGKSMTNVTITNWAGTAGRITGIAVRGLLWAHQTINWNEVGEIVLHGLQVLIVFTLLAGQFAREAWNALPALSEHLGKWYARLLVGSAAVTPAPQARQCAGNVRMELEKLSCKQIRERYGIRRKLAKKQLIELALAA